MRTNIIFLILSLMVLGVVNGGHGDGHGHDDQGHDGPKGHGRKGHDDGPKGHGRKGHDDGPQGLTKSYYQNTCPLVTDIVKNITWNRVASDKTLGAKLLRVHYHDCFVKGCDASILLDSTPNNSTEKDAIPNRSLSGYDVIDAIKEKLEEVCPRVVSCADILALAARDAVSFQFGESKWDVFLGRKDGRVSLASEALSNLPSASANFATLLNLFASKGLDIVDLVALSGAHTIGVTHCSLVSTRLYNFTGRGDADPSLNSSYAETLKTICPKPINRSTLVDMDPQSALTFDSNYYVSLNQNKGIFVSDAALLTNPRSAQIARALTDQPIFFAQFAQSMKNMGAMPTEGVGEVRTNCRVVNA